MSHRKPTTGSRRITDADTRIPACDQSASERDHVIDDLYESWLYARLEADADLQRTIDADRDAWQTEVSAEDDAPF